MTEPPLLLAFDLTGTFVFAVNGALTGLEAARLDIVGMVALGIVTAVGGGIVRDILINAVPPPPSSTGPTWRSRPEGRCSRSFSAGYCGGSPCRSISSMPPG
jgi:hypothetical protein